jgi:copper chaperone CopZ
MLFNLTQRRRIIMYKLQLANVLDASGAARVTAALRELGGVLAVQADAGSAQVSVAYDEARTSPQEIATVAQRSGFALPAQQRRTSCCGGCGGG